MFRFLESNETGEFQRGLELSECKVLILTETVSYPRDTLSAPPLFSFQNSLTLFAGGMC